MPSIQWSGSHRVHGPSTLENGRIQYAPTGGAQGVPNSQVVHTGGQNQDKRHGTTGSRDTGVRQSRVDRRRLHREGHHRPGRLHTTSAGRIQGNQQGGGHSGREHIDSTSTTTHTQHVG